ncbi:MAG: RibD family protein, partial [Steroidobacteraceae bacterium]
VWIFTASDDRRRRGALEARGARVERVEPAAPPAPDVAPRTRSSPQSGSMLEPQAGRLDLQRVLARLAEALMNEIQVEAGPTLAGELIRRGLADELLIYAAPVLLGPDARALAELPRLDELSHAPRYGIAESQLVGDDLRLRLRPRERRAA